MKHLLIAFGIHMFIIFVFLNLPLWANFYNYTDLSHTTTTTMTLDQPTILGLEARVTFVTLFFFFFFKN